MHCRCGTSPLRCCCYKETQEEDVQEALTNHAWISDLQGARVTFITDFFRLWDLLSNFELQPEVEDKHVWRLASNGQYSAKSAYEGLFLGSIPFRPWERKFGSLGRHLNVVCFCGWLLIIDVGQRIV